MLTIAPAPVLPATLPDSASTAPFGPAEAEGVNFATELALAMGAGGPAKLRPVPGDGIRVTIAQPEADMGEMAVERAAAGLERVRANGGPVAAAEARAAEEADAPTPLPEPTLPEPTLDGGAVPLLTTNTVVPDAEVQTDPATTGPVTARTESSRAEAEEAEHPVRPTASEAPGEGPVRPNAVPPTRTAERPILSDAEASDREGQPRADATPEASQPPRTAHPYAQSPPTPEQAAFAAVETADATEGAEARPDRPTGDDGDASPGGQPAPEVSAREPTPEAIGLAAAAAPATRAAGEPVRPRSTAAATPVTPTSAPSDDVAEPGPRPAPAEAKPREAAEARPRPAERPAGPEAPTPEAAADVDPAEPTGRSAERPDPPASRAEPPARALAQPGMPAEALPQLQPVERTAAPAAAPAPPRTAPAPPAQQIAPILVTLATGAEGMPDRLMLTLDPQELGRIEVEVTREGERRIAIAVLAERPETLHLLMRDAAILDRALAQAGVGAEGRSLAFDLGGGSDGRQQRGSGSATPAASQSPQPEPTRRRDPLSLLDIAI